MRTFKQYSNIALLSALFMMTFFMGGCDSSSCEDTGRTAVVLVAPIITSTIPVDDSTNVPVNTPISATFSEEINPATVVAGTFTVVDANGEPVPGRVSYSNNNTVMIFTPDNNLDYSTIYTATITDDVTDMEGNTLDISNGLNVWSFTTINEAVIIPPTDTTPPIVTSTIPVDGSINVPVDLNISATFSEEINPATVVAGTFTVVNANDVPVDGTVSYSTNNTVMIFTPTGSLDYNTTYTATITTDVTDMDGNNLDISNGLNVWSFTTINEPDVVPPTDNTPPIVISTIPIDGATNVPLNRIISALFSKELEASTIVDDVTAFTLHNDTNNSEVDGTVTYNSATRTAYFTPTGGLTPDINYTATITTDVTDTGGLNLDDSNGLNIWSFSTAALESVPAVGPEPVNLGRAGEFVILTKAGITNIPTSAITGNIGSSPITAAELNTVSCSEMAVGSFIHGVDAAYTGSPTCFVAYSVLVDGAVFDMEAAYTDAATRTPATGANLNIGGGSLDGQIFAPGLYTWGSDVTITNSITLTGNADDTWIFQISGNLSLASNAQIILGPNVQAKNIFWQIAGSNTTIGTGAQFKGIVLGFNLIAVQTDASVDGRLLSQKAVTLQKNRITQPAL